MNAGAKSRSSNGSVPETSRLYRKKIEGDTALSTHAATALPQFDRDGKLSRWPHKFAVHRVAMWGLLLRFDSKRRYTEKEVKSVWNAWHLFGDHATLWRELINMDLLERKPDCSAYWKNAQKPSDEIQVFLRVLRGSLRGDRGACTGLLRCLKVSR